MILCCGNGAQHAIRDRLFREFPVLFDRIEFRAVRWKILQAQRFAARAAKSLDGFAFVPRRIIDEENQSRVLCEELSHKADERFLCLSCDETEDECAFGSCSDHVKAVARVVRLHDGTAAFQRPTSYEVGRDDDGALVQTRDCPAVTAVVGGDAFCFFLNRACALLSIL